MALFEWAEDDRATRRLVIAQLVNAKLATRVDVAQVFGLHVNTVSRIAQQVAAQGVTVNVVSPGPTDTPLLDQVAEASQKLYDGLARAIPMRRIGQPSDIAPAVVFLASDGAGYITGQTLSVSGGLTMV